MLIEDPTPTYDFPPHKQGDTWKGLASVTFKHGDNCVVDLTNATVRMQVRKQIDSPCILDLSSDNCKIIIMDPPTSGTISIPRMNIDIPPDVYLYDLKVIFPTKYTKTYFKGIFPVTSHLTR